MKNTHLLKQTLQSIAQNLGFELVYSDLRTGCFHIRQGTIVRAGYVWRNIKPSDIVAQINNAGRYGDRLDTMQGSTYFTD